MSLDRILTQRADVAWKDVDGQVILMDLGPNKMVHRLNSVGSFIWKLLNGKNTLNDILNKVCDEFTVDKGEAEKDLLCLIDELLEKGILHGS